MAAPSSGAPASDEPAIVIDCEPGAQSIAVSEAIAFELDQAGYRTSAEPSDPTNTRLSLHIGDERWELVLVDTARDLRLVASGSADDAPAEIGVHAAELVYAAQSTPVARPSPAREVTPPRRTPPVSVAVSHTPQPAALRATAPVPVPKPRLWGFAFSATASSLGTLGALLEARRRWTYLEVGASLGGGSYSSVDETTEASRQVSVAGSGFVSVGVGGAVVLRSDRKLRPRLGLDSDFIAPIVTSRYSSTGGVTGGSLDVSGTDVYLMWAPALTTGFDVSVGPRLSIRTALRGGVTAALRNGPVAGGGAHDVPRWFYGGSVGLVF